MMCDIEHTNVLGRIRVKRNSCKVVIPWGSLTASEKCSSILILCLLKLRCDPIPSGYEPLEIIPVSLNQ